MKLVITFADGSEREFEWEPTESDQWYEARVLPSGVLGIFYNKWSSVFARILDGSNQNTERMVEAYAQWCKVVTQ